ncbi:hypothetical protein AAG906_013448 [Vitis piasezkii]
MENCREEVVLSKPLLLPSFKEEQQRKCVGNAFSSSLNTRERKLVCVTSGNSHLSSHIVRELLAGGYLVRVTIQKEVDFGVMNELLRDEEMNQLESVVVAKMGDLDSLCDAFRGCHAVFHTSSFIDIHGVSGYSEWMAFLETEAARNVIEACCRAAYVKRCIFTSSLLASIWTDDDRTGIIDESCWSDEEFCRDRKLWLAMGKTAAEKVAWSKSQEMKVKLVTVCPGFSWLHHSQMLILKPLYHILKVKTLISSLLKMLVKNEVNRIHSYQPQKALMLLCFLTKI